MDLQAHTFRFHLSIALLFTCLVVQATPDLELKGLDGSKHSLSEYIGKGKWVVLNIWSPDCPPCKTEIPELIIFHKNHKDSDAIVVGIAIDFPSFGSAKIHRVQQFTGDNQVNFPILLSDGEVTQRIGAGHLEGLPATYLYSPKGELKGYEIGAVTAKIIENFIKKQSLKPNSKKQAKKIQ